MDYKIFTSLDTGVSGEMRLPIPWKKEKLTMKAEFYDVKSRTKIEAEVKYKVKYENGHYGIVGEAPDGRKLPKFVSEDAYNTTYKTVKVLAKEEPKAKPAAKACCAKKGCKK